MMTATYIYVVVIFLYVVNHYGYRLKRSSGTIDSSNAEAARISLVIICAVLLIRATLVDLVRVPSESMQPTIDKDTLIRFQPFSYGLRLPLTNERFWLSGKPNRGDIALVRSPRNPYTQFVKRVVGVPGDTIELVDGLLKVNGQLTTLTLLNEQSGTKQYREDFGEQSWTIQRTEQGGETGRWQLTDDQYFVLGDNRNNSRDSRFWGPILDIHLIGKVTSEG